MEFQIPVDTLFTQVFGLAAPKLRKYNVPQGDESALGIKYSIPNVPEINSIDWVESNLGTPIQFPMKIIGRTYNVVGAGELEKVPFTGMYLPWTSVASFSRSKRMTKTPMNGYKGSVIEQYGFNAWDIKIQGFIIKENNQKLQTVDEQVRELQQYEEITDAIEVGGPIFEWLKIKYVALDQISYPSARNLNMEVIKPFEITMESIEPIELVLL